jgi:hypothetical protein
MIFAKTALLELDATPARARLIAANVAKQFRQCFGFAF